MVKTIECARVLYELVLLYEILDTNLKWTKSLVTVFLVVLELLANNE